MNPVSEGHGARGKVVKAFSVFKGSKQRKKKALCKEGDEGGMGSVLISETWYICIFQRGGNQVRVGWKDTNRCSHGGLTSCIFKGLFGQSIGMRTVTSL